jgi:hypothetical protein
MIVDRRTYNIKLGQQDQAIQLLQAEMAGLTADNAAPPYRIYLSHTGRFGQIAVEWDFGSPAERETFWRDWRPHASSFIKQWYEINQGDIQIQVWELVERG